MSGAISERLAKAKVVIPTFNARCHFPALSDALLQQGIDRQQVLVIDSSSTDGTSELFREFGAKVTVIPQAEFNHGGTRRLATALAEPSEFLIFLTQDALPAHPQAFAVLLATFDDDQVGMAYGRQLPRPSARAIERHARLVNYPADRSEVRSLSDRDRLGVRTVFSSDSFAAYRRTALQGAGGFPEDAFFAEDQIVAGQMLLSGGKIAYTSEACVVHSHRYTPIQDFKRYFDVGVFHSRNRWLIDEFGRAEGDGMRFVISEIAYLWREEPLSIPGASLRTAAKYLGYRLGQLESRWSNRSKARMSMFPGYWVARESK